MSEHLARHVLERLLVDDARDSVPPELRAHLSGCERCSHRMRRLGRARAEYAAARPAARFAQRVAATAAARREPSRWLQLRRPSVAVTVAAVLAAAIAVLAVQPLAAPHEPDAIRYKGSTVELQVYVRRGAQTRALRAGEALSAGDQLAFAYSLAQPRHLLLFGIDDAGTISRYFPDAALAPNAVLPAGSGRQLPVGIELDARRGQERLVALFSDAALDEARARAALGAALRQARARGRGVAELGELALPAEQVSVWFEKP
jgi:hypothetical protein